MSVTTERAIIDAAEAALTLADTWPDGGDATDGTGRMIVAVSGLLLSNLAGQLGSSEQRADLRQQLADLLTETTTT